MGDLPKMTPAEIVEELRDKARDEVRDMNADRPAVLSSIGIEPIRVQDTVEWQAADCIEDLLSRVGRRRG